MVDINYAYDLEEAVDPIPKPGFMEKHEFDSLNEIRKMISQKKYKDSQEVREHMLYLERLGDKLRIKLQRENNDGESGWMLKYDVEKVHSTFKILERLLNKMG